MAEFTFPDKLRFLLTHRARYKVIYGGRSGAKTTSMAQALLVLAMDRPLRVLCAREFQNSIADSSYKILVDLIRKNDLEECGDGQGFFTIMHDSILGKNGSEFRFMGIMTNTSKVRSFEGIDICWILEAAKISKAAMDILRPTIRKPGSEIWIEFNPDLADDYIYQTFVLAKVKPPRCIVVEINYTDNPWNSSEVWEEAEACRLKDPDDFAHIWLGKPKRILTGAVYAEEMRQAIMENRLTTVPYDSTCLVHTFWDLGWADRTAVWFIQKVSLNYHVIDYLHGRHKKISWYMNQMQEKGYNYGIAWLPHDAAQTDLGTGMSIEKIVRRSGYKVRLVPKLRVMDGINAVREVFPRCYFDEGACKTGIDALCNYHWNEGAPSAKAPVHDEYSHGADGFRSFGVAFEKGIRISAGEQVDESDSRSVAGLRKPLYIPLRADPGDTWML